MRSLVPRSVGPWLAVLTLTAAGAAAAAGYGLTAPKRYQATAQLLVSPVSVNDPTFTGLDVLRDSGGKSTAAASAAALLRSPQVADVVRADLGLTRSRDSLLNVLDAYVVGSSDVVAVTVEDTSAAGAAQLANAFADGLVKQRTASFQSQLAATIRRQQQLLAAVPAGQRNTGAGAEIAKRLAVLQSFQGQPDPTIRHAGQASAPASASWPELPQLTLIGAVAGLAVGLVVALLLIFMRRDRRTSADEDEPYDRGVSDKVAEQIAALEAERERFSAREAALAVRERDVSAKLVELREAAAAAPDGSTAAPAEEELAARAAGLDARVAELTQREIGLARRAAQVAKSEQDATVRTEELEARAAGLAARVAELTQREIGLARRAAELAKRGQETDALSEELAARTAGLDARAEELEQAAASAPEPEPVIATVPVAVTGPSVEHDGEATRAWNLLVLERLVNDRGDEFPDKRDEWSSYLYFLREYADPDGTVPASFDWLIQDTFADLVD